MQCHKTLRCSYKQFSFCPSCSDQMEKCMICGRHAPRTSSLTPDSFDGWQIDASGKSPEPVRVMQIRRRQLPQCPSRSTQMSEIIQWPWLTRGPEPTSPLDCMAPQGEMTLQPLHPRVDTFGDEATYFEVDDSLGTSVGAFFNLVSTGDLWRACASAKESCRLERPGDFQRRSMPRNPEDFQRRSMPRNGGA
jgi:hypothetical protein